MPCVCVCVSKPVRPELYLEHITEQVVSFLFLLPLSCNTVNRISSRVSGKHACTSDCGSCAFLLFFFPPAILPKVATRPKHKLPLHSTRSAPANKHGNKAAPSGFCFFAHSRSKSEPSGRLAAAWTWTESARVPSDRAPELSSLIWCQLLAAETPRLVSEEADPDSESVTE